MRHKQGATRTALLTVVHIEAQSVPREPDTQGPGDAPGWQEEQGRFSESEVGRVCRCRSFITDPFQGCAQALLPGESGPEVTTCERRGGWEGPLRSWEGASCGSHLPQNRRRGPGCSGSASGGRVQVPRGASGGRRGDAGRNPRFPRRRSGKAARAPGPALPPPFGASWRRRRQLSPKGRWRSPGEAAAGSGLTPPPASALSRPPAPPPARAPLPRGPPSPLSLPRAPRPGLHRPRARDPAEPQAAAERGCGRRRDAGARGRRGGAPGLRQHLPESDAGAARPGPRQAWAAREEGGPGGRVPRPRAAWRAGAHRVCARLARPSAARLPGVRVRGPPGRRARSAAR